MSDTRVSIEDLLASAATPERERMFAQSFEQVRLRLRRIASFRLDYRLRGRVSESDIVQDTYVRAASHIDRLIENPELPFFVWLRLELQQRIAEVHRQHLDAGKRDVRREQNLHFVDGAQTSLALAARLAAQITSASRVVERDEAIESLRKALDEMNEMDREVIALRHFEELTNIETARILGIEPEAASKRYLRALRRMREIFLRISGESL